jgi:hypothetical protein
MRKTVEEREAELRSKPVEYHPNGTVRMPVTYSQLLRECERLHALLGEMIVVKEWHDSYTESPAANPHWRRCWNCRVEFVANDGIVPDCLCPQCGSQDTRRFTS